MVDHRYPLTVQGVALTRGQTSSLIQLLNSSLPDTPEIARKHEFKQFKVDALYGGSVSVLIETGYIGDEEDVRSVIARCYGHFFLGRRGGIVAARHSKGATKAKVKKYPDIYGWER